MQCLEKEVALGWRVHDSIKAAPTLRLRFLKSSKIAMVTLPARKLSMHFQLCFGTGFGLKP